MSKLKTLEEHELCESCKCELSWYGDCKNIACIEFDFDDENPNEDEGAK